jgi:pheromone shutdown-related protein TraB
MNQTVIYIYPISTPMKEELHLGQTEIIIVGTGHIFQESVDLAKATIEEVSPDYVALELDPERLQALQSKKRERPPFRVLLKAGLRMAILGSVLSYFQNKLGEQTGVFPGAEMLEAAKKAQEVKASVVLIDRPVGVTLTRLINALSIVDILRTVVYMLFPLKIEIEHIEKELVDDLTEQLYNLSPSAYKVLIEERDAIMAEKILNLSGTIVVVVGAGHVKGIKKNLMERYKNSGKEKEQ